MAQKNLIFVSSLIWQCQTGKPALPFKLNEGPQCALVLYLKQLKLWPDKYKKISKNYLWYLRIFSIYDWELQIVMDLGLQKVTNWIIFSNYQILVFLRPNCCYALGVNTRQVSYNKPYFSSVIRGGKYVGAPPYVHVVTALLLELVLHSISYSALLARYIHMWARYSQYSSHYISQTVWQSINRSISKHRCMENMMIVT